MSQSYSVIFNSRNAIDNSNLNSVSFYVNWASIIPIHKYKKYSCRVNFKSETYAGVLNAIGFINFDCGKTDIYDGTTQQNNIAIITPVVLTDALSFYSTNINDNDRFIFYPNDTLVKINLKTFSGTNISNVQNYVLTLNLEPVINDILL
jgi:hypothetical protein